MARPYQAFPRQEDTCGPGEGGMTLRDYFAAKAMQGQFAAEANPRSGTNYEPMCLNNEEHVRHLARLSYVVADAMLAERERNAT